MPEITLYWNRTICYRSQELLIQKKCRVSMEPHHLKKQSFTWPTLLNMGSIVMKNWTGFPEFGWRDLGSWDTRILFLNSLVFCPAAACFAGAWYTVLWHKAKLSNLFIDGFWELTSFRRGCSSLPSFSRWWFPSSMCPVLFKGKERLPQVQLRLEFWYPGSLYTLALCTWRNPVNIFLTAILY